MAAEPFGLVPTYRTPRYTGCMVFEVFLEQVGAHRELVEVEEGSFEAGVVGVRPGQPLDRSGGGNEVVVLVVLMLDTVLSELSVMVNGPTKDSVLDSDGGDGAGARGPPATTCDVESRD
jgi:hypothetical protein